MTSARQPAGNEVELDCSLHVSSRFSGGPAGRHRWEGHKRVRRGWRGWQRCTGVVTGPERGQKQQEGRGHFDGGSPWHGTWMARARGEKDRRMRLGDRENGATLLAGVFPGVKKSPTCPTSPRLLFA